jgi:hypothetical protein
METVISVVDELELSSALSSFLHEKKITAIKSDNTEILLARRYKDEILS